MRFDQVTALVAAGAPAMVAATAGVIPMSIRHIRSETPLRKRSDTYTETITNNISYGGYYASISVGTPAQKQDVVLDTGSSDTWFLASDASTCTSSSSTKHRRASSSCVSTYDESSSSTFKNLSKSFDIEYVDGSSVSGYYFQDTLEIAGASITELQMAVADQSNGLTYGIMGVGFDADESSSTIYPNVIDKFYTEGLIGARAYSLYLDEIKDSTGTILFGGLDTEKYSGDLIAVPIIKDSAANNYTSFLVTLSSVTSVDADGNMQNNYTGEAKAVVLDSGTTLTYLPEAMAESIFDTFNATYDDSAGYATVDCSLSESSDLALEYQFGGSDGPTIRVNLSELVLQDSTSSSMQFGPGGDGMGGGGGSSSSGSGSSSSGSSSSSCAFGVSMSSDTFLLGDTFLRSAYVVYDLDAKEVAMAQSNFNSTKTNIVSISSGTSIPEVSATASSVMASSTSGSTQGNSKHSSGAVSMMVAPWATVALGAVAGVLLIAV